MIFKSVARVNDDKPDTHKFRLPDDDVEDETFVLDDFDADSATSAFCKRSFGFCFDLFFFYKNLNDVGQDITYCSEENIYLCHLW